MSLRAEDQYHTGIVVDELDEMLDVLTKALGYRWAAKFEGDTQVCFVHGEETVHMRFAYSVSKPTLEVIQHAPGTLWAPPSTPGGAPNVDGGIHHIGYWADDVAVGSAELAAAGFPIEASGFDPEGRMQWSYHRSPVGPRIELVDRSLKEMFENWTSAEDVPSPE